MDYVSLNKALVSGAWLECYANATCFDIERHYLLRLISFERKNIGVLGMLGKLRIEVVNISKTPMRGSRVQRGLKLVDDDGFEFRFTKWNGCNRFADNSPRLSPKLKAAGTIALILPNEENNYYLAIKDGNIREI